MIRLFEQHRIRQVAELDGMWDFRMEGNENPYRLTVPGCWEQHPDFLNYRGIGIYERQIAVERDATVRLEFKGVSHTADVYWDDTLVAHHYNAFTPFSAVIQDVQRGMHTVRVRVDNTFGEHSALHTPNDYYTYGGIIRPVSMEVISGTYIKTVHFTPLYRDGIWKGKIEVCVCNLKDVPVEAAVRCELAGMQLEQAVVIPAQGEKTAALEADFSSVDAWTGKTPNLYLLNTILVCDGLAVDDYIERVGFRTVSVDGRDILLNGEKIYFKGFNRHEDYAGVGCAIPLQLMVQDLDLMKDMGANAVRTCHYPNDERFLDLCDERGVLVWEENHARGFVLKDMLNPNFDRQCEDRIDEMITAHYNHPSIVIWGILNECASEEREARPKYQRQYEQIRRLDVSRPTTSATCRHLTDICLDLPDVVSFNMYSGWYKDVSVDETNEAEIRWIRKSGGADKPIIVSEFGAAAIYGYRDRAHCKWSEERQADIIRENLEVYMNHPDICGVFIWQFADCRVTEEGDWFASRARCHNNKGVVDEYRRPKIAYDVIKGIFNDKK